MTREERLAILGADDMAEIRRRVAATPPPPPALLDELRHVLAPALARLHVERIPAVEHQNAA